MGSSTPQPGAANSVPGVQGASQMDRERIYSWIMELSNPAARENALLELSKKREVVPDLAPMLWHSFGNSVNRCRIPMRVSLCVSIRGSDRLSAGPP